MGIAQMRRESIVHVRGHMQDDGESYRPKEKGRDRQRHGQPCISVSGGIPVSGIYVQNDKNVST